MNALAALWSAIRVPLLSVGAIVSAFVVMVLLNSLGAWLVSRLGIAGSGQARLGWDLAWTVLGGLAAIVFASRYAPLWPRVHGAVVWAVIAAASLYAAWDMGRDYPYWFVVLLLAALPLQAAGIWLGTRWRPAAPPR